MIKEKAPSRIARIAWDSCERVAYTIPSALGIPYIINPEDTNIWNTPIPPCTGADNPNPPRIKMNRPSKGFRVDVDGRAKKRR